MKNNRLLYEKSVAYCGHLIIPYCFDRVNGENIYSYKLLSALGHKGEFHKADNPAGMYSSNLEETIEIAREHLEENSDVLDRFDLFKSRYTYHYDLIIIHQVGRQYYYDHYKPDNLNNIAAPKLFESEYECMTWIKAGLDRQKIRRSPHLGNFQSQID
ncbi:hypothetical protein JJD41_00860 [Oxynema sp. CENA135]|uniref:hypothetical protein n=1 Tax=Oxynema sp. CENA135 TaxID=984206 RepID=UPI00190B39C7|nr:hypothetical protein [Oxynema sp. CENA135]MBK4728443.1 hypothetical protein [Oxynema sp. CENA135]